MLPVEREASVAGGAQHAELRRQGVEVRKHRLAGAFGERGVARERGTVAGLLCFERIGLALEVVEKAHGERIR